MRALPAPPAWFRASSTLACSTARTRWTRRRARGGSRCTLAATWSTSSSWPPTPTNTRFTH
eukprot:2432032-Prymnesium_polylepis.1